MSKNDNAEHAVQAGAGADASAAGDGGGDAEGAGVLLLRDPSLPRRRWRRVALWCLCGLVALPLLGGAALLWRLSEGPIDLPAAAVERIEAQLDNAMAANDVTLGAVDVALSDRRRRLVIQLSDVDLNDPDGSERARFPSVRVDLSTRALLRGQVRPRDIEVIGAGVTLRRDAEGQFDLALTGDATGEIEAIADDVPEMGLENTLARIDAMFEAPEFAELDTVSGSGLSMVVTDAVSGQVIRLSDAGMRLERKGGAITLTLGGGLEGSRAATLEVALNRVASLGQTNVGLAFTNLAAQDLSIVAPALGFLELMQAPISGFLGGQIGDAGTVGDLRATLDIGTGEVTLEGATQPLGFDAIAAELSYDADRARLTFDSLSLASPALSFSGIGHADVGADGNVFVGQFRFADIVADGAGVFDAPVAFDGAALDMRLTLAPEVDLEVGQIVVFDERFDVRAHGRVTSRAGGLDISLDAHVPSALSSDVMPFWPETAAPGTRRWLAANLEETRLTGVDFAWRSAAGDAPEYALSFDFQETLLHALPSLPPIEGGAGYLSLVGSRLDLRLEAGVVTVPGGGPVDFGGSRMAIANTAQRGPEAVFSLAARSELTDLLRLLAEPPVRMFRDSDLTAERVGVGRADMRGEIVTRLLPRDEQEPGNLRFDVAGTVSSFRSDTLIEGRILAADRVTVEASSDAVTVSGRASLDGVPGTGQWTRALGPDVDRTGRVTAQARLDADALSTFGVALPPGLVSGEAPADIDLTLSPDAPPILTVRSNLDGMALSLPTLGWSMSQAQTGTLNAVVRLGDAPAVTSLQLEGAGLALDGRVSLNAQGGFGRLTADRFRVGSWLNVSGALIGRGAGQVPAIEIAGGTADLRGAPTAQAARGGAGGPVAIALDRLQISEGIALRGFSADLSTQGGASGQFRGSVNGAASVSGTLTATGTGPAIRVRADDGGAVLRAAGVFRTAFGGDMDLRLQATGATGTFDGDLNIDGPRLRDAPVMAELLNIISVVGLLEQLSGDGINLGEVDARFRLTPTQVILTEGAAVGPSMGISMDGRFDIANSALDMQGVVSPLYAINGLIGGIFAPRREGLFGFSYRLTGQASNPQVAVNPLSILTPGIFRDIFRRPAPVLSEAP